jgi:hypothetical protein
MDWRCLGRFQDDNLLRRQLSFIAVLALAIGGVAYANASRQPLVGYWKAFCAFFTEWPQFDEKQTRVRLLWTQALHFSLWGRSQLFECKLGNFRRVFNSQPTNRNDLLGD